MDVQVIFSAEPYNKGSSLPTACSVAAMDCISSAGVNSLEIFGFFRGCARSVPVGFVFSKAEWSEDSRGAARRSLRRNSVAPSDY